MIKVQRQATLAIVALFLLLWFNLTRISGSSMISKSSLLSDPFLQLPTETSVQVVWFTEFVGVSHRVIYGDQLQFLVEANSTQMSRLREDARSQITSGYLKTTKREIWRHQAQIEGLKPGRRLPYQVISVLEAQGEIKEITSDIFTLAAKPQADTPLKILLTSDHQLKPLTAANLQKVVETVGRVDGVFFAGDLVNVPDRASEWFDDSNGGAFFPCLQGRANYALNKQGLTTIYHGGELIQHAPIFTALGNHEVMGRFSEDRELDEQFEDAFPRSQAEKYYQQISSKINPDHHPEVKTKWVKDNSFNTDTYEEIFSLPESSTGGKQYYALTFGDIRLVVLYVTNIWRSPSLSTKIRGRYQEREIDLNQPENWGYGQHIFEPITVGSPQYQWLQAELSSEEFQQAKYKVVMFHHPAHSLGNNIVPPYTNPILQAEKAENGNTLAVNYYYPLAQDYIIQDLIPLLESAGVQLVFYGHSHLWNRFFHQGTNFLESSNVGNSYGAYLHEQKRPLPQGKLNLNYAATGNPNGLGAIIPNLAPLQDTNGQSLPYVASNDITVFSILDTDSGTVKSYRFDTRNPNSGVILFDEFSLLGNDL
jgi:uncharacterized membrane protein